MDRLLYYKLHSLEDILFIPSKASILILPIGLFTALILFWIFYRHQVKGKMYLSILLIVVITIIFHWVNSFSYFKIMNNGIFVRKNIFHQEKCLQWSSVKNVCIDLNYSKDRAGKTYAVYEYYMLLETGEKINFRNSEEFWHYDKALFVNTFLKSKNLKFKIAKINDKDLQMLVETYGHNFGEKAEDLFREFYHYYYRVNS